MPQTSYTNTLIGTPWAGMLYDLSPSIIESCVSAEASAEIPFGGGVKSDGTAQGMVLCTANTDVLQGIVVHSHNYDRDIELGTVGIRPKCRLSIMRKGRIWVAVNNALTLINRGYWNFTTSRWAPAAAAPNTIDASKQTIFRTIYTGSDGLAVIECDFTNIP